MKVEYLITQHWYNGAKIERSSLYDFPNLDKTKQRVYKITTIKQTKQRLYKITTIKHLWRYQ